MSGEGKTLAATRTSAALTTDTNIILIPRNVQWRDAASMAKLLRLDVIDAAAVWATGQKDRREVMHDAANDAHGRVLHV